jgi:hypothetical protein
MDFLIVSLMFLMILAAATWGLVESAWFFGRAYRWLRLRLPSHLSSWWYGRQVEALRRRYMRERARRQPVNLGALRFTRSRAEQFGDGPADVRGHDA